MKKTIFLILLILSCPRPGIQQATHLDYLQEAKRSYKDAPLYAYKILNDSTLCRLYPLERASILTRLYLEQREYQRAAQLLDSIGWNIDLNPQEKTLILLKNKRWDALVKNTDDTLLVGIAYYRLNQPEKAIALLSTAQTPADYRILYLAKAYIKAGDLKNAFSSLLAVDSFSNYLYQEYQDILFDIFLNFDNLTIIKTQLSRLEDPGLRKYILLKFYEKKEDNKNIKKIAWQLIKKYPASNGAYYALQYVRPKANSEDKAVGKVYYYHNDYKQAIVHLKRATPDNSVNYYLGRIYYAKKNYPLALHYLSRSNWSAAYYYRGRIYEKQKNFKKALTVYDSLYSAHQNSKYAKRGFKRKAFLLEDIGDTLRAVETFLKINEKNTHFRAAMQLFKLGSLTKADSVLQITNEPEFLYWRMRIRQRLGQPFEELKTLLCEKHPLSYYTVVRINNGVVYDTMQLDAWIKQFDDSTISFSSDDSLHLVKAIRYLQLNEIKYAESELELINDKSAQDYLYLSRLCCTYGADKYSILYALRVKKKAQQKGINIFPVGLYRLMYPVRYIFTIVEQNIDPGLCLAMIWQESLFDPEAHSWAGARGIMQIISPTAEKIARDLNVTDYSLNDPNISIKFGTYYFSNLLKDFKSVPLSLAGYNAGPVRVKRWIEQDPSSELDEFIDLIPYNETRNYVKLILSRRVLYKQIIGI